MEYQCGLRIYDDNRFLIYRTSLPIRLVRSRPYILLYAPIIIHIDDVYGIYIWILCIVRFRCLFAHLQKQYSNIAATGNEQEN